MDDELPLVSWPILKFLSPTYIFETGEAKARHFKFGLVWVRVRVRGRVGVQIETHEYCWMRDRLLLKGLCLGSCDLCKFMSGANTSDLKWPWRSLLLSETFVTPIPREIYSMALLTTMCLNVNQTAHVTYNFNCLIKPEGLLKVKGSHVHCKCGSVSETMQDSDVTTDH